MSDSKRLGEVTRHIARIKESSYPVVSGQAHRIEERSWKEVPEPSKLAILQDAVDWSGVTNRDRAHLLLSEIDPGKISDAQRNTLIDMALAGGATAVAGEEKPPSETDVKALHQEWKTDYAAANLRDTGQDYEAFLNEAASRAMTRMQGKDQGRER